VSGQHPQSDIEAVAGSGPSVQTAGQIEAVGRVWQDEAVFAPFLSLTGAWVRGRSQTCVLEDVGRKTGLSCPEAQVRVLY